MKRVENKLSQILLYLNNELQIETVGSCSGHLIEPLKRQGVQPSILFKHTETSLRRFLRILDNLGLNPKRLNESLRSAFDIKNNVAELRWLFQVPEKLYKFNTVDDILDFWNKFEVAMKSINK